MKSSLFTRVGWFYFPCSIAGGVLCLLAAAFCATVFVAVDRHSHSASDTLYGIYPFFVTTFLLLDWIARRSGESPSHSTDPTPAPGMPPAGREPRHG
jgi:hypothetical protein